VRNSAESNHGDREMGINVAVVGATGAVGQEMLKVLWARRFPLDDVRAFASARSAGKKIPFGGRELVVRELGEDSFAGTQIALFSIDKDLTRKLAPAAVRAGAVVVDNSNAHRMEPHVPLVVPEVNGHRVRQHRGIVANPNCSTILMVMVLGPLHKLAGVERVVASTYQAVSGAGLAAMEELLRQTRAHDTDDEVPPSAFPHPIAFNLIPRIGSMEEGGETTEELKMLHESRKILETPDLAVSTTCVRLPVLRAHSEAVNIRTHRKVSVEEVREALRSAPGVEVVDDPGRDLYPMPLEAAGRDEVLVGRIREDTSQERGIDLFLCGDQLLKGAALNAVQIAEILVREELLGEHVRNGNVKNT
jgi:aspartate-semialdehyde dehydrogenase